MDSLSRKSSNDFTAASITRAVGRSYHSSDASIGNQRPDSASPRSIVSMVVSFSRSWSE